MIIEPGREGDFHQIYVCDVDEFPDEEFSVFVLTFDGGVLRQHAIVRPFAPSDLPWFHFGSDSKQLMEDEELVREAMAAYVEYTQQVKAAS